MVLVSPKFSYVGFFSLSSIIHCCRNNIYFLNYNDNILLKMFDKMVYREPFLMGEEYIINTFREINLLPESQECVLKMIDLTMWQYPFLCYNRGKTSNDTLSKMCDIVWWWLFHIHHLRFKKRDVKTSPEKTFVTKLKDICY